MRLRHAAILLLAGAVLTAPAYADEVSDKISQALAAYQNHDSRSALEALDAASHMLREARAGQLKALLPLPPPGWTADPAETSAVSAAMLGGGTTASRTYHHNDEQVEVQLTTDSPMLQGMAALMDSPAAAASGVKIVTIGGQPMSYSARDNGFMSLIGKRVILKVDGNKLTSETTLRTFIASMDFTELQRLAH